MPAWFAYIPGVVVLGVIALIAGGLWYEVRRHRRELVLQRALLTQAQGLVNDTGCATCGTALSPWDRALFPLPAGVHVAPIPGSSTTVECELRRSCPGCGRDFVIWLWADGDRWGFEERPSSRV